MCQAYTLLGYQEEGDTALHSRDLDSIDRWHSGSRCYHRGVQSCNRARSQRRGANSAEEHRTVLRGLPNWGDCRMAKHHGNRVAVKRKQLVGRTVGATLEPLGQLLAKGKYRVMIFP